MRLTKYAVPVYNFGIVAVVAPNETAARNAASDAVKRRKGSTFSVLFDGPPRVVK